jgi:peptidoglycan hydrolase-like protein with peptidoglycan-binding domain
VSAAPSSTSAAASHLASRWRRPGWRLLAPAALLIVAAAAIVTVTDPFASGNSSGVSDNRSSTSLATVERRSLSSQTPVDGTLGYAGNYSIVNHRSGTITSLPAVGQIVKQGQTLYRIDGFPVILLYGSTPAYRDLRQGESGADVQQLNAALVALGYASEAELSPSADKFGWRTRVAVKKLQADLGVEQTGMLALGTVVFQPRAVRITVVSGTLGAPAGPGALLTATSTRHQVSIQLDAAQQSEVKVGDPVTITLPDSTTTHGRVSSVGKVASTPSNGSDSSTPTIEVKIRLLHQAAAGQLDQAPVVVLITTASVKNALVVPVNALLALAGGGYAVEAVNAAGVHRLVPVTLGQFDDADGLVQVSGSGLWAGQRIVVPAS